MRLFKWAILAVAAGLGLVGCGSDPTAAAAGATRAGASQTPDPPQFPQYIVYLQPSPGINPLFADVQAFIKAHDSGTNLAASYPPHVSFTGFFNTALSESTMIKRFEGAVDDLGTPFGQPLIRAKGGSAPGASAVSCDFAAKLITLHVRLPSTYNKFRGDVTNLLGAQGHEKTTSHITLFEAANPGFPPSTFGTICTAAHSFFDPRMPLYNSQADGYPKWEVALFRARALPLPTNPLSQATDVVISIQVN